MSEKDSVPIFDTTDKEIELSLAKHALLLKKQLEQEKRLRTVSTDKAVIDSANLVFTGAPASDTKEAAE